MHRHDRLGLDCIQHAGAAGHRAGMPVLELPAGDEHHRVLGVGPLVGGNEVGRHELRAPGGGREMRLEHHRLARIAFVLARIGHRGIALQALPRDALDGVHAAAHLVEHLFGTFVLPVQPQPARELDEDPEVRLGFSGRVQGLAAELHHAVGVGDGAVLLGPRGGGQHHVGEVAGLGEEDVLHHQVLELRHRRARVVDVRIRHRRVLAHHVHAADLALVGRVHDLDHRQAGLLVEPGAPELLEALVRLVGADALVVRDTSSGSGPSPRRPARCSGRAADAGRCRGGRSGRSSGTARSGSARCRCRGCAG